MGPLRRVMADLARRAGCTPGVLLFSAHHAGHFLANCRCRRRGIRGSRDRATDNQIVGAVGNRLARGHDPLLIAHRAARWPDARRHQKKIAADGVARLTELLRREDKPIDAGLARLAGAAGNDVAHPIGIA